MSNVDRSPGTAPTRRRARWERFRVIHPFSPRDLAGLWGAIIGVVALALLLGWGLEVRGGAVIVAALPFIISWFEQRRTAFQFDAAGVRIGNVLLPWSDVSQFAVATPPGDPHALIGVRLRPGAALPPGAVVPPRNPAMPAPIHVAVQRPRFHLTKLIRKAHSYAPSHVQIMIVEPTGERAAV
ncbi:hypothetical protein [Streptomyces sp. NPDC048350]|uniref:hypothetical protein n=1 Tax=Streptomyces sp. NPDC048350 TaxID=3365538 RepID=UPI0037107D7E